MSSADLSIRLSVWLALVAWAVGEIVLARGRTVRLARRAFSFGALALLAHLALAFHFHHGWSHAAAVAETARQTAAKFGVNWGGGVWFNYALASWWLLDAAWSWRALEDWAAPSWPRFSRRAFFLFMWFNGAVVFPTGPVRWVSLLLCVGVLLAWLGEFRRSRLAGTLSV